MDISIITPVYNRLDLTTSFLRSLEANPPPGTWEIVWVDDGSVDGTREWLKTLPRPRHRVLFNEENLGFAANNNLAARAAQGTQLILLNNDLVLTPGWYMPLLDIMGSQSRLGIVGNVQLRVSDRLIDHAGMGFDLVGDTIHFCKNQRPDQLKREGAFYKSVTAACWLVQRELFLTAGWFDPLFRNGYEDADLCLRLDALGYRHWVSHSSRIFHHVSSSPGRNARDAENRALFLERWAPVTARYGERDWPSYYIHRIGRNPRHFNLWKFIDALLRAARLRTGDSNWARCKRDILRKPKRNE